MQTTQLKMQQAIIVLTVAPLLLSACGEKMQQPSAPQSALTPSELAQPEPAKLFQPQRSALDKAKAVEQTVEKSSEESKQEMERQTQ